MSVNITSVNIASVNTVPSPCVRNCCLDPGDICLGCGRHLMEITGWQAATDEQKQVILQRARERQMLRLKS